MIGSENILRVLRQNRSRRIQPENMMLWCMLNYWITESIPIKYWRTIWNSSVCQFLVPKHIFVVLIRWIRFRWNLETYKCTLKWLNWCRRKWLFQRFYFYSQRASINLQQKIKIINLSVVDETTTNEWQRHYIIQYNIIRLIYFFLNYNWNINNIVIKSLFHA